MRHATVLIPSTVVRTLLQSALLALFTLSCADPHDSQTADTADTDTTDTTDPHDTDTVTDSTDTAPVDTGTPDTDTDTDTSTDSDTAAFFPTLADYIRCTSDVDCPVGMGRCLRTLSLNQPDARGISQIAIADLVADLPSGHGLCTENCTIDPTICDTMTLRSADGGTVPFTCRLFAEGTPPYPPLDGAGDPLPLPFDDALDIDAMMLGQAFGAICMPPFQLDPAYPEQFCAPCHDATGCTGGLCYDLLENQPISDDAHGTCLHFCADGVCPAGFTCTSTSQGSICLPDTGTCTACRDLDRDERGTGRCDAAGQSTPYDCDDRNPNAYFDADHMEHPFPTHCGTFDYNCNGLADADEQVGTPEYADFHCTACHDDCDADVQNGFWACDLSEALPACVLTCDDPTIYRSCTDDGYPLGACETERTDGESVYFCDMDGDGFGSDPSAVFACPGEPPPTEDRCDGGDWVLDGGDCNDHDDTVYPGAPEICDRKDNDCNGYVDEAVLRDSAENAPLGAVLLYEDADGDGFGNPAVPLWACPHGDLLPGQTAVVDNDGDCNDAEPEAWTGRGELCDCIDNDCDGRVDNHRWNSTAAAETPWFREAWYEDADGDGFGRKAGRKYICPPTPECPARMEHLARPEDGLPALVPARVFTEGTFFDCNDADPEVYPGADEICNDINDDCDAFCGDTPENCDDLCDPPWSPDCPLVPFSTPDGWGDIYTDAHNPTEGALGDLCHTGLAEPNEQGTWVCIQGNRSCSANHDPALHVFDPMNMPNIIGPDDGDGDGIEDRNEQFIFVATQPGAGCTIHNGTAQCPRVHANNATNDLRKHKDDARNDGKHLVIATGHYRMDRMIILAPGGVHLLGGYTFDPTAKTWTRSANSARSTIVRTGQDDPNYQPAQKVVLGLHASNVPQAALIEQIALTVETPILDGASAVGLWAYRAQGLILRRVDIDVAGATNGLNAGTIPANGSNGNNASGTSGGISPCGNGQNEIIPSSYSWCSEDHIGAHGTHGNPGKPAFRQMPIYRPSSATYFFGRHGGTGNNAAAGTRGGGGIRCLYGPWLTVRDGGGGGGAGCGGIAGGGGRAGGSAFGMQLRETSNLTLSDVSITTGNAGTGGHGMHGGNGGRGGDGQSRSYNNSGGNGGHGGGGAGGGGGDGGHSVCIIHDTATGTGTFNHPSVSCVHGTGGTPGSGGAGGTSEAGKRYEGGRGLDGWPGIAADALCLNCTDPATAPLTTCQNQPNGIRTLRVNGVQRQFYCKDGWTLVLLNSTYASGGPAWTLTWAAATGNHQNLQGAASLTSNINSDYDLLVGLSHWEKLGNRMRLEQGSSSTNIARRSDHHVAIHPLEEYRLWTSTEQRHIGSTSSAFATVASRYAPRFSTSDQDHDNHENRHCANSYGYAWWYDACWEGSFWGGGSFGHHPFWANDNEPYNWGAIWLRWE